MDNNQVQGYSSTQYQVKKYAETGETIEYFGIAGVVLGLALVVVGLGAIYLGRRMQKKH